MSEQNFNPEKFGIGVLNFMLGGLLTGDGKNSEETVNKIENVINTSVTNTVNNILKQNQNINIKNVQQADIIAGPGCVADVLQINQNISSVATVMSVIDEKLRAQFINEIQTKIINEFKIKDEEEKGILDYIASILGVRNDVKLRNEINNTFNNFLNNTINNTTIAQQELFNINGQTANITCIGARIKEGSIKQNINAVIVAQSAITKITDVFTKSAILNNANNKVEYYRSRKEAPSVIWVLLGIAGIIGVVLVVIFIILLIFISIKFGFLFKAAEKTVEKIA